MDYLNYIEENTLRLEAGIRGGGIEIDLGSIFPDLEAPKMSAYQNYLGSGMLGAICSNCNFDPKNLTKKNQNLIFKISKKLKKYFHKLTNHAGNEWETQSFGQNQSMPASAY